MFETIPQELKFDALWCCWKFTERGKVPFDVVKNTLAKSNDRETFYSYKTILNYLPQYLRQDKDGKFLGGLGLGIFNGFSAIDIDHCIDENGVISEMAQEIIDYCQSYTEKSPSGRGIRIIFKTDFKDFDKTKYYINNARIGLEIYTEGITSKFVTITGNALNSSNIVNVDIKYLLDKYMLKKKSVINFTPTGKNTYNITDFLDKDEKLNNLYNRLVDGNESELDLALCCKLAFYLQCDPEAIKLAFENSPYFAGKDDKHVQKWVSHDYAVNTINKAIESCTAVYSPQIIEKKSYDLNDTGNAHRFCDKYSGEVKYNVDNKMWMIWNGCNWQFDMFGNVKNLAEILIEEMKDECFRLTDLDEQKRRLKNVDRLLNKNGKDNMLSEAQHLSMIPVCNDMFDKNDYYFNCNNGVINLKTGVLLEHNKNLLLNKISSANLVHKKPVKFLAFLDDIFEHNTELIHYLHKAFGYSLTGSCEEQCMFILQGDGNDGKSLLLQIIQEVIGDYSATSNPDLLLDKKYQSTNLSEVARLKGIRFCVVNELKMGDKLNESSVKDITSGNNKIVARFLYGNEFEFLPKMKIWLATNYEPKIIGTDKGIWRRMVLIPCKRSLKEDEVDKKLIFKLREEKDEILNWLVEGCLLWQKEGLQMPQCLKDSLYNYKTDMDLVQRWLNEYCDFGIDCAESSTDLFKRFSQYCKENNEFAMSQTLFGRNLSKKFQKRLYGGSTMYIGVQLKGKMKHEKQNNI